MDPDQALLRLLELSKLIVAIGDADEVPPWESPAEYYASELAETLLSLDDWLRKGGFRPKAWSPKRRVKWPSDDDKWVADGP